MLTYQNHIVKTSVRRLVEFLERRGSIETGTAVVADVEAMQEGSRLHRKIQKAQGPGYKSEVPLKMSWQETCKVSGEPYELLLEGRADGIETGDEVLIDEIKCLYQDVTSIEEADPLHLAQARCYAYMYGADLDLSSMIVRITYCNIETEEIRKVDEIISWDELSSWFHSLIDRYRVWADYLVQADGMVRTSIESLSFPFEYRPGQKQMAALVYRAVQEKKPLFLQAPTGIGKTVSALYPSLKGLGQGLADRIFYLTAKTITRTVAEDTLKLLNRQGMKIHGLTITARDRICILSSCDPESCPRAKGHYDRINGALYNLLTSQTLLNREVIESYARIHQVCPYELSFEAAAFCQCVICDYNYIFDPHANVRGMLSETNQKRSILLIDEAHNLPDRARSMYSADLKKEDLRLLRKYLRVRSQYLAKRSLAVMRKMTAIEKMVSEDGSMDQTETDSLQIPMYRLLDPLQEYLKDHPVFETREEIVEIFFRLRSFLAVLEREPDGYKIYSDGSKNHYVIHYYCVDPSYYIEEYLERARTAVFFSATLLPVHYYRQLLGGRLNADVFRIPSPFSKERRLLMVANDVTSRYSRRGEDQYRRIIGYLQQVIKIRPGNYMIFFPSYEMLSACESLAAEAGGLADCRLLIQKPEMEEGEKEAFLQTFSKEREGSLIGFCVLGSLFSEGIDLTGDRLIGVLIVGTGLPRFGREREIIRSFFDRQGKKGYDYAYSYPGINKVLQAAGRVIRTDRDRGIILLLDDRFLRYENQLLMPEDWDSYYEVSLDSCDKVLKAFWERFDY